MIVLNANYDIKTAITRDMKNSLAHVSNDLVLNITVVLVLWRVFWNANF